MIKFDGAMSKAKHFVKTRTFAVVMLALLSCAVVFTIIGAKNEVYVSDGEKVTAFATLERDTERLLDRADIPVNSDDEVVRNDTGASHISIEVLHALNVSVVADGKTTDIKIPNGDVADALEAAGVETDANDNVSSSLNSDLTDGMKITVERVMTKMVKTTESVPFSTEKKYTSKLSNGTTKTERQGKDGTKTVVTMQTLVNDKVVSSKVVSETVETKPVNKIVLIGTKSEEAQKSTTPISYHPPVSDKGNDGQEKTDSGKKESSKTFVDSKGKTVTYKKCLEGRGTAYTAAKGAKTSTGRKAQYGVVAVNPKVIPYGTKLYIVSVDGKFVYGYAVAGDTGSALRSGRALVDLYYNTKNQCYKFGSRTVRVYVL